MRLDTASAEFSVVRAVVEQTDRFRLETDRSRAILIANAVGKLFSKGS